MDLKYVRSELRKLSEIVEGWNANQEIGSLERDLVLDKLRTLYEAVRFGAEAEPPAADASGQEPFPTEIPVSLDLGEVLSIESLSVAEPELPSLSGSGPEPESGFIAPLAGLPVAESGADFPDCDTAVAETVAESVLDSVPADGQEPAGGVGGPAASRTISDWKRKGTNPSADKILKICEVLKVTPYELLGENETERNAGNPEMSAGNETEKIILEGFRNLSDRKKERILGYLAALQED